MRQQLLEDKSEDSESKSNVSDALKNINTHADTIKDNADKSRSGYSLIFAYLLRWRASIYRLIWIDMLIWLILYYILNIVYRLALNEKQKQTFQDLVEQIGEWSNKLPVTFLLGFFVSNIMSRWWNIYSSIPRMSGPAHTLVSTIEGKGHNDEEAARYRMEIARYLNLAWVMALTSICGGLQTRFDSVKRSVIKFGQTQSNVDKGKVNFGGNDETDEANGFDQLMQCCIATRDEIHVSKSLQLLATVNCDPEIRSKLGHLITPDEIQVFIKRAQEVGPGYNPEWFIPVHWALTLSNEAVQKKLVHNSLMLLKLQAEIRSWSAKIRKLRNICKRQLPLVYIQVATIAVYTVYLTDVISRQILHPDNAMKHPIKGNYVDYFVPIISIVHVVFLIGWFKVALVLLDPLGNDDEDFPLSSTLDSNVKAIRSLCGSNADWYPRKSFPSGKGPESDDAALKTLKDFVAIDQQQRQNMYGTFDSQRRE